MNSLTGSAPAAGSLAGCRDRTGRSFRHTLLHFRARSSQFGQRGVELIAAPAPGVEQIRSTAENRSRGLLDHSALRG